MPGAFHGADNAGTAQWGRRAGRRDAIGLDIITAAILAVIQGITEWLPISSSGHLVVAQAFLGEGTSKGQWLLFDLMVHVASMLAVVVFFRSEVKRVIAAFFSWISDVSKGKGAAKALNADPYRRVAVFIVIASVPTVLIGYLMQKWFETAFAMPAIAGAGFIFTGILLAMTYRARGRRREGRMRASDAVLVGAMQGVAIMPGISRSGSTISTGIFLGLDRETAARFSFLLAIPAIIGALALHIGSLSGISGTLIAPLAVAFILTFIVGYLSLGALMAIIKKRAFYLFSIYCFAMGATVLWWFLR